MFNKFADSFSKATGVNLQGGSNQNHASNQSYTQQQQQQQQQHIPYQQHNVYQCSHPSGPKRAVLIGINYR